MTSLLATLGLTVDFSLPFTQSGGAEVGFSAGPPVTERVTRYGHTITAVGGYDEARITLALPRDEADEWFRTGLMRHVAVRNEAGERVWEGFVNGVDMSVGNIRRSHGPVMEIANKVRVHFTTRRWNTNPPIGGVATTTAYAEDTISQAKWGILVEEMNANEGSQAEAGRIRDMHLAQVKNPKRSWSAQSATQDEIVLDVSCLGYYHWLKRYTYTNFASGTQNLSAKITAVLNADPNSIFDVTNSSIATNTFQVLQGEDGGREAWAIIKTLVSMGDASDNRHVFGVYNDRRIKYAAIPTTIGYIMRAGEPQHLTDALGARILPWDIKPGRWVFDSDIHAGAPGFQKAIPSDFRYNLIERVQYTAPWDYSLEGGDLQIIEQRMARMGIIGSYL